MKFKTIFLFSLLMVGFSGSASADVPLSFSHHGVLKIDDALVSGQHHIEATIYNEKGATLGSAENDINIKNGQYYLTIENIDVEKAAQAS